MTQQEMLLKYKMNLLQLAEQLQNIRQACKMMGVSRQHYYDIKARFEQEGLVGLKDKPRPYPNMPNKTPDDIESRIINYSLKHPTYGKDRLSIQLRFQGIIKSPSAIERIWKRHKLENRFKRLMKLEELHRQQGMILSDEQIQALLENLVDVPAEHVFSRYPGYLLCQDTFEVGHIKGVGKIYMQAVIDTYGSFGFAKLYTSKMPTTCADILIDRVIPFYMAFDIPIRRMLTDNGGEFCGKGINHDYELVLQIFGIEHKKIRVGMPQTNGFVERFNRTLLEEFFCVAFRKKWYYSLEELQQDLDTYLWHYNFQRPHLGYRLNGKRPIEVLLDRTTYPKRLTYDKIDAPKTSEVSTQLQTCTAKERVTAKRHGGETKWVSPMKSEQGERQVQLLPGALQPGTVLAPIQRGTVFKVLKAKQKLLVLSIDRVGGKQAWRLPFKMIFKPRRRVMFCLFEETIKDSYLTIQLPWL